MAASPAISASGLTKSFGRHTVLKDVSIAVPQGSVLALLGPNGAGKTTMKIVSQKLIEQDWCGHDNPTWKYTVRFEFDSDVTSTTVHVNFSGKIQDEQKDLSDWRDYYFDPIKKLLEKH